MLEKYSIHTDLALEEKERFESDHVEVQGVILEEEYDKEREIRITKVKIETEKGARAMGKPVGTYITMEAPNMAVPDEEYHREISEELAKYIKELIKIEKEDYVVLVAGLGNRQVTPDALGPHVVDNLAITRHIVKEYGKYAMGEDAVHMTSAIVPGVMAQTGMETLEIIKGIVKETKPDLVIAVDALAARNSKRLNRTIQIADTGRGIRQEELTDIFKRFYRSPEVENMEGSGIGLYLSNLILEKEKGYITAVSEYGKGSCFSVSWEAREHMSYRCGIIIELPSMRKKSFSFLFS